MSERNNISLYTTNNGKAVSDLDKVTTVINDDLFLIEKAKGNNNFESAAIRMNELKTFLTTQGPQGPVGNQGPKGDKGDKGDIGPVGPKGDRGETGLQGPVGIQGLRGDQGLRGMQGEKGDRGESALIILIQDVVPTESDIPDGGDLGHAYLVEETNEVHYWNGSSWLNLGILKGDKGDEGEKGEKGDTGEKGDPGQDGATYDDTTIRLDIADLVDDIDDIQSTLVDAIGGSLSLKQKLESIVNDMTSLITAQSSVINSANHEIGVLKNTVADLETRLIALETVR